MRRPSAVPVESTMREDSEEELSSFLLEEDLAFDEELDCVPLEEDFALEEELAGSALELDFGVLLDEEFTCDELLATVDELAGVLLDEDFGVELLLDSIFELELDGGTTLEELLDSADEQETGEELEEEDSGNGLRESTSTTLTIWTRAVAIESGTFKAFKAFWRTLAESLPVELP